jgi:predicted amidohydrolase YtcJ
VSTLSSSRDIASGSGDALGGHAGLGLRTPPPGLVLREAHAHLPALGESLTLERLDACGSLGECLERVRATCGRASAIGESTVRLASARVEGWPEARWPTLSELDEASGPSVGVVIMSFDHHLAMANSAALAGAGLRAGERVNERGVVEVDEHNRLTGLLLEDAAYKAWGWAGELNESQRLPLVTSALRLLADLGYRQVHDLHSPAWLGPALRTLDERGELTLDVGLYVPLERIGEAVASRGTFETPRVSLLGAKVFADGTLNGRTAHMLHRYSEPRVGFSRGQCLIAPLVLDDHIRLVESLGVQLAIHAIGDGAVRTVLDCVKRVRASRNRVRIEHAEVVDRADVARFGELGVTCSVQPCHLLSDIEALRRFLPHRLDRVLPLRELLQSGLKPGHIGRPGDPDAGLVFGSDVPIVRAEAEDSIVASVLRRRVGVAAEDAIAPEQAITEAEAWSCFGIG